MRENFSDYGTWMVSVDDEVIAKNCLGRLEWNKSKGAKLEILQLSKEHWSTLARRQRSNFILNGALQNGKMVTLPNAICNSLPPLPDCGVAIFSANDFVEGDVGITDIDNAPLSSAWCPLECLSDLVVGSHIGFKLIKRSGNTTVTLKPQKSSYFATVDGIVVKIGHGCPWNFGQKSFKAHDVYRLELHPETEITYKRAHDLFVGFRDFCTLALDRPVLLGAIGGNLNIPEIEVYQRQVNFYHTRSDRELEEAARKGHPIAPFSLSPFDVSGPAFEKFCQIKSSIRMAIDFFFSGYYGQESFINQRFADIVHGLEGLHRGLRGGTYTDQQNYDEVILPAIVSAIPKGIDCQLRQSLKKRLEFGNEFSLRRRLKDLVKAHHDYAGGIFGKVAAFGDSIAKLRNTLAHANGEEEPSRELVINYLRSYHRCKVLFQLELFHQLGFDREFLANCLSRLTSARFILESEAADEMERTIRAERLSAAQQVDQSIDSPSSEQKSAREADNAQLATEE